MSLSDTHPSSTITYDVTVSLPSSVTLGLLLLVTSLKAPPLRPGTRQIKLGHGWS